MAIQNPLCVLRLDAHAAPEASRAETTTTIISRHTKRRNIAVAQLPVILARSEYWVDVPAQCVAVCKG